MRFFVSGGAALPPDINRFFHGVGIPVYEGYGLTEASPIVTTSTGVTPRFGSVGRALAGVEIRLVNDNGDALVGDARLFARQDGVEEAWRIVDDALSDSRPVVPYERGSWGPDDANALLGSDWSWITR